VTADTDDLPYTPVVLLALFSTGIEKESPS
jgi:hypothetical protein